MNVHRAQLVTQIDLTAKSEAFRFGYAAGQADQGKKRYRPESGIRIRGTPERHDEIDGYEAGWDAAFFASPAKEKAEANLFF